MRFKTDNELKKWANWARKRQKGLTPSYLKKDVGGDFEGAMDHFNRVASPQGNAENGSGESSGEAVASL